MDKVDNWGIEKLLFCCCCSAAIWSNFWRSLALQHGAHAAAYRATYRATAHPARRRPRPAALLEPGHLAALTAAHPTAGVPRLPAPARSPHLQLALHARHGAVASGFYGFYSNGQLVLTVDVEFDATTRAAAVDRRRASTIPRPSGRACAPPARSHPTVNQRHLRAERVRAG